MTRRRMMSVKESGAILPSEYQQVEYIENTSTAYINTNYIFTSNIVGFKGAYYIEQKPNAESCIVCSRNSSSATSELGLSSTNGRIFLYSNGSVGGNGETFLYGNRVFFNAELKPTTPIKNLVVSASPSYEASYTGGSANANLVGSTVCIFTASIMGSLYPFLGKVYFLEVYDNGNLVCSFIPCYRKSDGEVGMFDIIRNGFYASANSRKFTKGADV